MDKATKVLLYVILGVVLFQGFYSLFFSHSRLRDAVNEIKSVKSDLKMVSDSLNASRKKISSILENINDSQSKISLMKQEVGILYLDYQKRDAVSSIERQQLKQRLTDEEKYLDSLRKELEKIDN